jgi:hypothetical protein
MHRASDLAKGKKFLRQLLYVQHVDKEKDTASEIPEQSLREYLLNDSKIFSDSTFSEYLKNPNANLDIVKIIFIRNNHQSQCLFQSSSNPT